MLIIKSSQKQLFQHLWSATDGLKQVELSRADWTRETCELFTVANPRCRLKKQLNQVPFNASLVFFDGTPQESYRGTNRYAKKPNRLVWLLEASKKGACKETSIEQIGTWNPQTLLRRQCSTRQKMISADHYGDLDPKDRGGLGKWISSWLNSQDGSQWYKNFSLLTLAPWVGVNGLIVIQVERCKVNASSKLQK